MVYTAINTKIYGPPGRVPYSGFGGALEAILGGVVGAVSVGSAMYGTSLQYKLAKSKLHAEERAREEEKQRWEQEMQMRQRELAAAAALATGSVEPDPMSPGKEPGAIAAIESSTGIPSNYLVYGAIGLGALVLIISLGKR